MNVKPGPVMTLSRENSGEYKPDIFVACARLKNNNGEITSTNSSSNSAFSMPSLTLSPGLCGE